MTAVCRRVVFCCAAMLIASSAYTQEQPARSAITTVDAPSAASIAVSDGDAADEQWERFWGQTMVRNVAQATIYPVIPDSAVKNGRSIVVIPGGGYRFVSMDSEGFRVAERLAEAGYAAFVLKYRPMATPRDPDEFMAGLTAMFSRMGEPGQERGLVDQPLAVDDLAAAIRKIRDLAGQWDLDPDAIGMIGFSAGAHLAASLLEQRPEADVIRHVSLIYPPIAQVVSGGPRPPLFMAIAVDDPLFRQGGLNMIDHWLEESRNVEFHLYSGGGHGFGMRPQGTTSDRWIDHYIEWLQHQSD